jgi:hypothetical protein
MLPTLCCNVAGDAAYAIHKPRSVAKLHTIENPIKILLITVVVPGGPDCESGLSISFLLAKDAAARHRMPRSANLQMRSPPLS